jgi:hypothetical protein
VAGRGEEAFIGRYAQAIHLAVGVLDCTRTYPGESLPEPEGGARKN